MGAVEIGIVFIRLGVLGRRMIYRGDRMRGGAQNQCNWRSRNIV